jgi:hypothetical protein
MPVVEQLLSPGCSVPACCCGEEMRMASKRSLSEGTQMHIRIYDCPACHREMHLTVWGTDALT